MVNTHDADAAQLAELGYKQEFDRKWNGFQNFAISFSIISILSGCFTTFGQAWANGGPVAISIGWPVVASLIMIIALCMAELVSAMPTAGKNPPESVFCVFLQHIGHTAGGVWVAQSDDRGCRNGVVVGIGGEQCVVAQALAAPA